MFFDCVSASEQAHRTLREPANWVPVATGAGRACPELAEGSARATDARATALRATLGFQFGQQLLDAIFFFKRGQAVVNVVARDF
jgi:hypothetical protein